MSRALLALAGLLLPLGLGVLGGFMGVFLMAMCADSASSKTVERVAWTYKAWIGCMVAVGVSGLVIGPAAWLDSARGVRVGLGIAAGGAAGGLLAFGRYYVAVARG